MPISPETRRAQCTLAVRTRDHGPDHPATAAARAEYKSARYLEAVAAAVASAPPLTPAQRARLAQILAPVVATVSSAEAAA